MANINNDSNKLATDTPDTTTTTTTGGVSVTFSSPSNGPCNLTFTPDCGGTSTQNPNQRLATDTPDVTTTTTQQVVTIYGINFPYTFYPSDHGVDDIFGTYTFNCGGCEFIRNIERVCNDNDISYTILGDYVTTTTTEEPTTTTTTTEDETTTTTTEDETTTTTTEDETTTSTTTSSGCTNYMLKAGDQFTEFRYIACGETAYTTEGINRDQSRVVCSENIPIITVNTDGAEVIDTGESCTEIQISSFYRSTVKSLLGTHEVGNEGNGSGFCDTPSGYTVATLFYLAGNYNIHSTLLGKTVYTDENLTTTLPDGYYYTSEKSISNGAETYTALPGDTHKYIRVQFGGTVTTTATHDCDSPGGGNDEN